MNKVQCSQCNQNIFSFDLSVDAQGTKQTFCLECNLINFQRSTKPTKEMLYSLLARKNRMLYSNSNLIQQMAFKHYQIEGKGAFYYNTDSINELIKRDAFQLIYLPLNELEGILDRNAVCCIQRYNVEQSFVIISSLSVSKRFLRKDKHDCLTLTSVIHKDEYKLINQEDEKCLLFSSRHSMIKNGCIICNQPTEKRCSGCKDVSYCSTEHQKEHWRNHKQECLRLKQSRLNAKSHLKHLTKRWNR